MQEKKLLIQYKEFEKNSKFNPNVKNSKEYVQLVERLAQIYSLQNNHKESNRFLLESRNLYYNPSIDYAYGMNKLFMADISGFSFYHNRYKKDNSMNIPSFPMEQIFDIYRLNKEDRILILNEQGIGDEILFSRIIPILSDRIKGATIKVRQSLLEYFEKKFYDLENIKFITIPFSQKEVNKFNTWSLMGDLFASLTEKDMFYKYNEDKIKTNMPKEISCGLSYATKEIDEIKTNKVFTIRDKGLKIGISYSHGTLDNAIESDYVLSIKKNREVPQEWFIKNLLNKNFNVVDYTYNQQIEGIKSYQEPKDFYETYMNLKNENINLIITIDSSFGHFTADMGIPTIIVINKYKDWRWSFNNKEHNMFFNNIKVMTMREAEKLLSKS